MFQGSSTGHLAGVAKPLRAHRLGMLMLWKDFKRCGSLIGSVRIVEVG